MAIGELAWRLNAYSCPGDHDTHFTTKDAHHNPHDVLRLLRVLSSARGKRGSGHVVSHYTPGTTWGKFAIGSARFATRGVSLCTTCGCTTAPSKGKQGFRHHRFQGDNGDPFPKPSPRRGEGWERGPPGQKGARRWTRAAPHPPTFGRRSLPLRGRGDTAAAAAALEGVLVLNLAPESEILTLLALLDRLCAMLTRLAHMGERPSGPAQIGQRERSRER